MIEGVTISGTRATDHRPEHDYTRLFGHYLEPFLRSADVHLYVGGALGIDTLALRWLMTRTEARITVVVPGTVADQPEAAAGEIQRALTAKRLDQVVELRHEHHPSTDSYHARNRWMIERSQLLVAFPLADHTSGGTAYTIEFAASQRVPYLIVPV